MLGVVVGKAEIVLEIAPLGPLHKYLKKNKATVRLQDQIECCRQIAEGMNYLGSMGIVHRDLAARNVLVARPNLFKISDFGMSRKLEHEAYYKADVFGKWPLKWLAKESIAQKKFTVKSDVWSYAVTCWECLSCGKRPWAGLDAKQVWEFVHEQHMKLPKPLNSPDEVRRAPPWLWVLAPLLTPGGTRVQMYTILCECWRADPQDRPSFRALEVRKGGGAAELAPQTRSPPCVRPAGVDQDVSGEPEPGLLGAQQRRRPAWLGPWHPSRTAYCAAERHLGAEVLRRVPAGADGQGAQGARAV